MKHIKTTAFIVALSASSMQANAGIWDSITGFFGSSDEAAVSEPAQNTNNTAGMVTKGLQLLPLLTQQLGVSGEQAQGGMGAILQAAQILMPNSEYTQMASVIPGVSSLLSSAPSVSTDSGSLTDSVLSMAAEQSDTVKAGTQLVSQFQSLGMEADMIPKFTGVAQGYLEESSEPGTAELFSSALSSFMK